MDLDDLAHELAHDFVDSKGCHPSGAANYPKRPQVIDRVRSHENLAVLAIKVHSILAAVPGNGELWSNAFTRMLNKAPSLQQLKPEIIEVLGDAAHVLVRFDDVRYAKEVRLRVQSLLDAVRAS